MTDFLDRFKRMTKAPLRTLPERAACHGSQLRRTTQTARRRPAIRDRP
jgi:hypothetical protein